MMVRLYGRPSTDTVDNLPPSVLAALNELGIVEWELFAEYTSPGTYPDIVLPANTIEAELRMVSSGSGGASGRRGLTTEIRCGGGGGAPGTTLVMPLRGSVLGETFTVVLSAGSAGGAAVAVDNTNGNAATAPVGTTVTASVTGLVAYAWPPTAPTGGGLGVAGAAGSGRAGMEGTFFGTASAAAGTAGSASGGHTNRAASGGGAGGGLTAANAASAGGNGPYIFSRNQTGALGGAIDSAGAAGHSPTLEQRRAGQLGGTGGGGGGSSAAGPGGAGGDGGYPGGGGGGGGASSNGQPSGPGGKGGDGYVAIWILRRTEG